MVALWRTVHDQSDFNLVVGQIIEGKMVMRKCSNCSGKGWQYYSQDTGEIVTDEFGEEHHHNPDSQHSISTDQCEVCEGLRYVVAYVED